MIPALLAVLVMHVPGAHALRVHAFELMATTGGVVTDIHTRTSINDSGTIAYVATDSGAQQVFVVGAPLAPTRVSFLPGSGRSYIGAAINDSVPPRVVSRDLLSGQYFVRRWIADGSGSHAVTGRSGPLFDSAIGFVDVNAAGVTTFTALKTSPSLQTIVYGALAEPPTELARYNGNVAIRPSLSDDNQVVFRDATGRIVSVRHPTGAVTSIAGASDGFVLAQMGDRPGISRSGDVIAFVGNQGSGVGLYHSVRDPVSGNRTTFRVAGTPDFAAITATGQRAGVASAGSPLTSLDTIAVIFGTRAGVTGIYRVDAAFSLVAGTLTMTSSAVELVVAMGATIDGRVLSSVELYDPINTNGVLAFFAQFSDGSRGIVRATPSLVTTSIEFAGFHHRDSLGLDHFADSLEDYSLLTPQDIIVVKVTAPDPDPSVRDAIELEYFTDVDATPRPLFAMETSTNSGVFYNYNPADGDSPDFPNPLSLDLVAGPSVAAIVDEGEALTIRLLADPGISATRVLDLAEVGVGWVCDYGCLCSRDRICRYTPLVLGDDCDLTDLVRAEENSRAVFETLSGPGGPGGAGRDWVGAFADGDEACTETAFLEFTDSDPQGIDTADVGAWFGHGPPGRLHFYRDGHDHFDPSGIQEAPRPQVRWGDDDLDWLFLFTCSFLSSPESPSTRAIGTGVREVMGFTNVMMVLPKEWMAGWLMEMLTDPVNPRTFKEAWLTMAEFVTLDENGVPLKYQTQCGQGAVLFDPAAANDHLPGFGDFARGGTFSLDAWEVEPPAPTCDEL